MSGRQVSGQSDNSFPANILASKAVELTVMMKGFGVVVVGLSAVLLLAPAAPAQQMDLELKRIARRPAAVEPAPAEKLAEQDARRAAQHLVIERERSGLVEAAREFEARRDRESILRDVRQYQTIQRALSGLRR